MIKLLADASLPNLEILFQTPFKLTCYDHADMLQSELPHHDVLLCRSTLHVTPTLLEHANLTCIATASSGTCHINKKEVEQRGITLIDAKGCNAEAVRDYMLSTFAYLKQNDLLPHHISKLTVGVMGVGEVGSCIVHMLKQLGTRVVCYDPLKAEREPDFQSSSFDAFTQCDVLCIHANLHDDGENPTRHILNAQFFEAIKPNAILINAARGGLLDEQVLLSCSKPFTFCTDVYQNEPNIHPALLKRATLCTPHIAGHSIEAKINAVLKTSEAIHTLYGLRPPPRPQLPKLVNPSLTANAPWYEQALKLYNPEDETRALKGAPYPREGFITLRKAHAHRHNFSVYQPLMAQFGGHQS